MDQPPDRFLPPTLRPNSGSPCGRPYPWKAARPCGDRCDHMRRSPRIPMAAANGTPRREDLGTPTNQPSNGDIPAEIREGDHSGDRNAAEPEPSALDWRNRTPDRAFDMSRVGDGAMSDRHLITALMTKNRTYGPERDAHMLVLANLDGIIQDPKRLRATTMMRPEQFDYLRQICRTGGRAGPLPALLGRRSSGV